MADEKPTSDAVVTEDSPCILTKFTEMQSPPNLQPRPTSLLQSSSSPAQMMRVRSRPPLTRTQSIKEKISHETAKFFGVLPESLPDEESTRVEMPVRSAEEQKWQQRRFRHLKQYGVKPELVENKLNQEPKIGIDALTDLFSGVQTVSDVSDRGSEKSSDQISRSSRAHSIDSRSSRAGQPRLERRDSVAKMAYDTFSSFVQGRSRRRRIGEKTPEEAPYSAGPYISIRNQRHSLLPTCSFPRSGAITPYEGTESEDFAELGPTEFSKQSRLYRSVPTRERHISEEEFPPTSSIEEQNIKESTESDKSRKAKPKLSRAERIDQEDIEKEETIESGSAQRPTHLPLATARVHFDSTKEVPKILPIDTKMRAQARLVAEYYPINLFERNAHGRTPMPSAMSIIDDEVFFDITPSVRSKPIFQFGTPGPEEFEAETRFKMPTPRQPTPMQPAPFPIKLPADVCPPTPDIKEITAEEEYMQRYYTRTPVHSKEMTIKTRTSDRPPMPNEYTVDGIQIKTPKRAQSQSTVEANGLNRISGLREKLKEKEKSIVVQPSMSNLQKLQRYVRTSISRPRTIRTSLSRFFHGSGEPKKRKRKQALPIYGLHKKEKDIETKISHQLENESYDYRPYFTWYITTIQIFLCIYYLFVYGIGTDFGSSINGVVERSGDVLATSLSTVHIVTWEQNNYWLGPSFADLVHMGAKYTPCMRHDRQIYGRIFEDRQLESDTGCCIGIDGCYQTSECPKQFASFMRYTNSSPSGHAIRAVCGQDPDYCDKPRSISPNKWSDNISLWPICEEKRPFIPPKATHMHCEIVGRPCCIQMQGQCRITTKEYCDFVRGYYHDNATLCSQVDCLNDICGMTQFMITNQPDQFYRFFLPLFIHAGIIRLLITVFLQFTIMRKFEIMIGWLRLSMIYILSGIGGYLASATFEPYMPETGPAGSQGGILGAIIVDIIYNWKYIREPAYVLFIHIMIAIFLLLTGFLPFIDNWAQIFGLIFGALWAAILIPYIGENRARRFFIIVICAILIVFLYVALLILFISGYELSQKFALINCPFPGKVCEHQGSQLKSWLPI